MIKHHNENMTKQENNVYNSVNLRGEAQVKFAILVLKMVKNTCAWQSERDI